MVSQPRSFSGICVCHKALVAIYFYNDFFFIMMTNFPGLSLEECWIANSHGRHNLYLKQMADLFVVKYNIDKCLPSEQRLGRFACCYLVRDWGSPYLGLLSYDTNKWCTQYLHGPTSTLLLWTWWRSGLGSQMQIVTHAVCNTKSKNPLSLTESLMSSTSIHETLRGRLISPQVG